MGCLPGCTDRDLDLEDVFASELEPDPELEVEPGSEAELDSESDPEGVALVATASSRTITKVSLKRYLNPGR